MTLLVDLSVYQHEVDFIRLKRYGVWGVCLRASSGVDYIDPDFSPRATRAKKAGLVVLSYHYSYFNDPEKEAAHYASVIKPHRLNGRPMLDVEEPSGAIHVEVWCHVFNAEMRNRGLPEPLYYGNPSYIAEHHYNRPIGSGLVLAAYGRNDGKEYPVKVPAPWKFYVAHQFTSTGRIPGIQGSVDVWHSHYPRRLKVSHNPIIRYWDNLHNEYAHWKGAPI